MKYRESVGKKIARQWFWSNLSVHYKLGSDFYRKPHLILASAEGGDIGCLRAVGVPDEHIFAVDRDPGDLEACRKKHGGSVNYILGDVRDSFRLAVGGHIYLDLCSCWCGEVEQLIEGAMSARPYRFSIALQKGREHKKYEIQNTADRIQKISKAADPTRIADEVWYAGYQGTSVPMLMVSSTFKSVTKLFGFHSPDHMLRYIDLYKPNLNRVKVLENRLFKERSVRDLRKIVLSYAEVCGIERASLGFNVPRSTVVAWKAHQTRGTYEAA